MMKCALAKEPAFAGEVTFKISLSVPSSRSHGLPVAGETKKP